MKPVVGLLCLLLGISSCRNPADTEVKKQHLPDIVSLYELTDRKVGPNTFKVLGDTLLAANQDLQATQLYIEAAAYYFKAHALMETVNCLHKALNQGMANPKILAQFPGLIEKLDFPEGKQLKARLDSIQGQLQNVDHYALEMRSVKHFWPYFERALKDTSNARQELNRYILEGPPEIRDFYVVRYGNLDLMYGQMINATPEYYSYLRRQLQPDSLQAVQATTRSWMKNFKSLYPQAVFPKVYVVPGILNSGGTATEMGMFVGGDMYGRSPEMPTEGLSDWQNEAIMAFEELPGLTIHELMHFQQNYRDTLNNDKVMGAIIGEGVCDFLVELSSGKALKNNNLDYLDNPEHLEFIIKELKSDLYSTDTSKWLYNGGAIEDRPHDLGYTLGYLISKSYYENQANKKQAVYDLLNTDNFENIYRESAYHTLLERDSTIAF